VLAFLSTLARRIESFNLRVGAAANWLYGILMFVVVGNVIARYGFGIGSIELEEIQWHLYSAAFLLGLAMTYARDEHVRVDVIHSGFSPRRKAWIELLGCLFLLLPFAISVLWYSVPYFIESVAFNERSEMPNGLPARYVIKGILSLGLVMLTLQAAAVVIQKVLFLFVDRHEGDG